MSKEPDLHLRQHGWTLDLTLQIYWSFLTPALYFRCEVCQKGPNDPKGYEYLTIPCHALPHLDTIPLRLKCRLFQISTDSQMLSVWELFGCFWKVWFSREVPFSPELAIVMGDCFIEGWVDWVCLSFTFLESIYRFRQIWDLFIYPVNWPVSRHCFTSMMFTCKSLKRFWSHHPIQHKLGHLEASDFCPEDIHIMLSAVSVLLDRKGSAAVTQSSSQSTDRWSKEARLCFQVWRRGRFDEQSPFLRIWRFESQAISTQTCIGHTFFAHFAGRVLRLVFQ